MRIGVNLFFFNPSYKGGINTFVYGLIDGILNNLKNKDKIIVYSIHKLDFKSSKIEIISIPRIYLFLYLIIKFSTFFKNDNLTLKLSNFLFNKISNKINSQCDVFYCPSSYLFPFNLKIKSVVSVHDIQFKHFPENFSLYQRRIQNCFFNITMKYSNFIQASSKFIKKDILTNFEIKSEKIFIISEGVDFKNKIVHKRNNSRLTFFMPAQIWPHKNHLLVLNSFKKLVKKNKNLKLILVGRNYMKFDIQKFIFQNDLSKYISYLGLVSDKVLRKLYSSSDFVICPAIYESSSLPFLEAISYGSNVIASDIEPNIEYSSIFKVDIFKRNSQNDFCKVIESCISKPYNNKISLYNFQQLRNFNWKNVGKKYYELFICKY